MKNLYIIFFLIISGSMYAQVQEDLENANWIFGHTAWLDFNNNTVVSHAAPPYATGAPGYDTNEGCASISDEDGNLLFFTDGVKVYLINENEEIETIDWNAGGNSLLGDTSSAQNIIIVPRPNSQGHYFLISINRVNNDTNNNVSGIYWSELNLNSGQFDLTTLNTPLNDGTIDFDITFNNRSEAITSCVAADGENMWIIVYAKVRNGYSNILSYKVTQDGIDEIPSHIWSMTNSMATVPTSLKVASDEDIEHNSLLALAEIGKNPTVGIFNRDTGEITLNNNSNIGSALTPIDSYSVEFSPVDNNILYFSRQGVGLFAVDLTDPTTENLVSDDTFWGLQRGLNNRIYAAYNDEGTVLEIDNTEDIGNLDLANIDLDSNSRLGLPQWIWRTCKDTLTLTSTADDIDRTNSRRERSNWIRASNTIAADDDTNVIYHAGHSVEFRPGFIAHRGSRVAAYIQGCTENPQKFIYKNNSVTNRIIGELKKPIKNFIVSPNPSKNFIDLTVKNDTFNKIIIAGIDGKIILDKTVAPTSAYNLDISRYASGVYIVNVISENGKQYSQNLIKN